MPDQVQTAAPATNDAPAEQTNQAPSPQNVILGDGPADPSGKTQTEQPGSAVQEGKAEGAEQAGDPPAESADEAVPEQYELKAPDGFELNPQLMEVFTPLAKELNLTNSGAQKLVETMMPKVVERMNEQAREQWNATMETWATEFRGDKEIGGAKAEETVVAARRARDTFATPELRALLDYPSAENPRGLGLGNHPEVIRLFARIGKAMSDDGDVVGGSATTPRKGLYSHLPQG